MVVLSFVIGHTIVLVDHKPTLLPILHDSA